MYMFLLLLFFYTTILFQVKIVIVDSVTFHFRQDFDDMALRTRLLSGIALKLMKLAKEFSLAVRINLISLQDLTWQTCGELAIANSSRDLNAMEPTCIFQVHIL